MINPKDAYEIMKKNLKENFYIVDMDECSNAYVFGTMEKGEEGKYCDIGGYDKVDKETGDVGVMWLLEWFAEVEAGSVKRIDISTFQQVS